MEVATKKKLLIYSDCYIYGGSEHLLACLILDRTIAENYEVHFAYRQHRAYEAGLKEDYGSQRNNFHPLPVLSNDTWFYRINTWSGPRWLKNCLKVPAWCLQKSGVYGGYNFLVMSVLIKKVRPQLIHVNNGGYPGAASCLAFVWAAKAAGVNNLIYQVNNIATRPKTRLAVWFDQKIINPQVKYFLTSSKKVRAALVENRNFPEAKIIVVPNTVANREVEHSREDVLKELAWPLDSFLLCQVAFLSSRKGQIFLLAALEKIRSINQSLFAKLRLVLVGDGEDEKILKKFIADNNLGAQVALVGYRADSSSFIKASDIFILPSIANEDMPLVILEAMRLGKTIIASRFGGIEEEIENNVSGILVEPNLEILSSSIAEAIINLYNDKNAARYGQQAQIRYNEYFSTARRVARLLEIYGLALHNRKI